MADKSTKSVQGVVFPAIADAVAHGHGGIAYEWKEGDGRQFPQDVKSVLIVMPVDWGDVNDPGEDAEYRRGEGVLIGWSVDHKNHCGAQWQLSGTHAKPTLSPSLNWVGMWHGWLRDGQLVSC